MTFRAPEAGVAIRYPADWTPVNAPDPEVLLVATPNGQDSMLLRLVELGSEIDPDDAVAMQQITDRIVRSEDVEVLVGPREISLAGLPGHYYLYRFTDEVSGQIGVHAHYFLFQGSRMIVMVFQALPAEGFEELAPTFDAVATSLRVFEPGASPEASPAG